MAAECGVAAMVIVGMQPARELRAPFGIAGVEPRICPFIGKGSVESLHLAVRLGSIGFGSTMFDLPECISE